MNAKQERKSIISAEWDKSAGTITFGVLNIGTMVLDVAAIVDGYDNLNDIGQTMMLHGCEQKVRDAAAIARDTKTGQSATPQEKFDAMQAVVDQLHDGQWNVKASRTQALNRAALFEAVAEVRGKDAAEVEAKFRDRPDEVLRAFLTHGDIAAAYARRTAKNSAKADALLGELE